jgi:hypothetical protein
MGNANRLMISAQFNRRSDGAEYDLIVGQLVEMQMTTNLSRNEAVKALLLSGVKHWGKPSPAHPTTDAAPDSSPELDRLRRELEAERAALAEMRAWLMQIGQAVLHDLPAQIAALPTISGAGAQAYSLPTPERPAPVLDSTVIQRGSSADDLQRVAAIMTKDDW